MISREFSFQEFLRHIEGMDFFELHKVVVEEGETATKRLLGFRTDREASESGCQSYCDKLGGFAFLLKTGQKPHSMTKTTAMQVKPIIEVLVNKGQLLPTALEMFNSW